jgi:hypothetical protein
MSDPVDDLMDKMAGHIAPDDQARQEELRAAWRSNPRVMDDFRRYAAWGYKPKPFDEDAYLEQLRQLIEASDDEVGHA